MKHHPVCPNCGEEVCAVVQGDALVFCSDDCANEFVERGDDPPDQNTAWDRLPLWRQQEIEAGEAFQDRLDAFRNEY